MVSTEIKMTLQWRYDERDGVSNHMRFDCLLSRSFRHCSKNTPKLRVIGVCEGNSTVVGEFPHRWSVNSPHKGPVTPKMFSCNDVIMDAILTQHGRHDASHHRRQHGCLQQLVRTNNKENKKALHYQPVERRIQVNASVLFHHLGNEENSVSLNCVCIFCASFSRPYMCISQSNIQCAVSVLHMIWTV